MRKIQNKSRTFLEDYLLFRPDMMFQSFRGYVVSLRKVRDKIVEGIIAAITLYQKTFSPDHGMFKRNRTARCRFFPSCSDYAIQSLRQYGLAYGIMFSLKRLGRCNPFCAGGYDPVIGN